MLAHGADYAIFFFPAAFGIGLWVITRKKKEAEAEVELAATSIAPASTKVMQEPVPQIAPERHDGAARLRAAMHQAGRPQEPASPAASPLRAAVGDPAAPSEQKRSRKNRPRGAARLRLLIDAQDPSGGDVQAGTG